MIYGVDTFTFKDILEIANNPKEAKLNKLAKTQILNSQYNVRKIVESDRTVYGINTGFGPLCDVKISEEETAQLQHNLIISHAVGVGKPIDKEISKIMMIAKVHALSKGFSGVSLADLDLRYARTRTSCIHGLGLRSFAHSVRGCHCHITTPLLNIRCHVLTTVTRSVCIFIF